MTCRIFIHIGTKFLKNYLSIHLFIIVTPDEYLLISAWPTTSGQFVDKYLIYSGSHASPANAL